MSDSTAPEMDVIGARLDGLEALIKKIARSPFPIPSSEHVEQLAMALAKAQGAFTNPPKNREVEVQPKQRDNGSWPKPYKFSYSTLDAIADMARAPLFDNGLAVVQPPIMTQSGIIVRTIVMHESGQWISCDLPALVSGNKGAQDQGSAITYARRYSFCAMLSITADEDDDGNAADGNAVTDSAERPARPQRKAANRDEPSDDFDPGLFAAGFIGQINKAKHGEISGIIDMNRAELDRLPQKIRDDLIQKANAKGTDLDKAAHETPMQKLYRDLHEAVKATTNRDALNDLLVIREDDLAILKRDAEPGYNKLMANVSKQDKFLAEAA